MPGGDWRRPASEVGRGPRGGRQAVHRWEVVERGGATRGGQRRRRARRELRTDKHKVIWICHLRHIQEAITATTRGTKRSWGEDQRSSFDERAKGLWREGYLHLVQSAPKDAPYTWRLTIAPGLEVPEELRSRGAGTAFQYCGIMLKWVGDRLYHHTALRNGVGVEAQEVFGASPQVLLAQRGRRDTWAEPEPLGPAPA